MTQHVKHVPKHRQSPQRTSPLASRTAARTVLALSAVALVGTGAAVAGGSLLTAPTGVASTAAAATTSDGAAVAAGATSTSTPAAEVAAPAPEDAAALEVTEPLTGPVTDRADPVSRSDRRGVADPVKVAALSLAEDNLMDRTEDSSDEDPRTIASALLADYGFSADQMADQMDCLDSLWTKESGWSATADNPTSSAYGIPQALPGSRMSTAGADWATNPVTQIRWGLGYIEGRYGSPCGAWSFSISNNWY